MKNLYTSSVHRMLWLQYSLGAIIVGILLPLVLDTFQTWHSYCYAAVGIFAGIGCVGVFRLFARIWKNSSRRGEMLLLSFFLALAVMLIIPFDTMLSEKWYQYTQDGQIAITAYSAVPEGSNSNEVWITLVKFEDGSEFDLTSVESLPSGWQKNGEALVATLPESIESQTVVLNTGLHHHIEIKFVSHAWSGYCTIQLSPQLRYDVNLFTAANTSSGDQYVFKFDESLSVMGCILCALFFLLMLTTSTAIIFILMSRSYLWKGLIYCSVAVAVFLLSPYIKPAGSVLLFLGGLCCAALFILYKAEKNDRYIAKKRSEWICAFLVSLYASFASFGYRLFLQGNYMSFSYDRCAYLLMGTLWFYPIILAILSIMEKIGRRAELHTIPDRRLSECTVAVLSSLIALGVLSISFIGFFPGGFPSDTVSQLMQARTNVYDNWHPLMHTLLIKAGLLLVDHPSINVAIQLVLFSLLIGQVARIPYACGIKARNIFFSVALFALLPNNAVPNISPLKDFPFTYVLVWAMVLLFKIIMDVKMLRKPIFLVELSVAMVLLKELRHNGIVPFAFMSCVLLIMTIRHWHMIKVRAMTCLASACIIIAIFEGPVFSLLQVAPNPVSSFVTMFCGVGSCLNKDKHLSNETMTRLEDVMSMENWKNYYSRFKGHDDYLWGGGENKMDLSSFGAKEAFQIYFEALSKYPDIVIKDRLDGMNIMWDVSQPDDEDSFNARIFDGIFVNDEVGLAFQGFENGDGYYVHNWIADTYRAWVYWAFPGERTEDQLSDMLLWRSGAYLIFLFILFLYWNKHHLNKLWYVAAPLLGNIVAMILVLYHQSFRYIYFVQLGVITLALVTFLYQRKQFLDSKEYCKISCTEGDNFHV